MCEDLLSTNGLVATFALPPIKDRDTDLYNDYSDKRDASYNDNIDELYGKRSQKFRITQDAKFNNEYDKAILNVNREPIIQNIISKYKGEENKTNYNLDAKQPPQYFKEYKRTLMISSANRKRNMQCRTSNTNFTVVFGKEYTNVTRIELIDFVVLRNADSFWNLNSNEGRKIVLINLAIPYKNPDILGNSFQVQVPLMYSSDFCPYLGNEATYQPNNNYYVIPSDGFTLYCSDSVCTPQYQITALMSNTTFGYARRRPNNEIDVVGDIDFYERPLTKFNELKVSLLDEYGKLIILDDTNPCTELDIVLVFNIFERVTVLDNTLLESRTDNYHNVGQS